MKQKGAMNVQRSMVVRSINSGASMSMLKF